ncbi:dihydrodipicolinate synthase [Microdochium bolleyi]|uniref:Dihydrodipicolinate synthase n=1 Tax=Microdochium bolleyi TaxID=196109 RepID=A0A136J012_9PEZI|nr:dihydrodipicolinate synthase [Microdochium bolleyi]
MGSNIYTHGSSASSHPLVPGIYVPTVAFFHPDESVDVVTTAAHVTRLAATGIAGVVTHGSNGEAVHLDHDERRLITETTRRALDAAGKTSVPVIVGCGAQSTWETVQLCHDAAASGGSHALILPPAYYGSLIPTDLILDHFRAVADASPVPILIYNFPGACAGVDLSSDVIIALAAHPNIVGVKLTCGNTGKLARVVSATRTTGERRSEQAPFLTFGGSVDFTLQTLVVGGHGIIGGTANLAPRTCTRLVSLWQQGTLGEARELQATIAEGDWVAIQGGFPAVKAALNTYFGYGGKPRKPCVLVKGRELARQLDGFKPLIEMELALEQRK